MMGVGRNSLLLGLLGGITPLIKSFAARVTPQLPAKQFAVAAAIPGKASVAGHFLLVATFRLRESRIHSKDPYSLRGRHNRVRE